MCGEDEEKNTMQRLEKKDALQEVSDIAISKLLQDFSSAELFPQSGDSTLSQPLASSSSSCEAVVISLKDLHLRRPANSRRKVNRRHRLRKRHPASSLNLAVAAGSYQKPIVWPARLSGQSRRGSAQILNPSRLCMEAKHDKNDSLAIHKAGKVEETSTLPEELSKKAAGISKQLDVALFGSVSTVDYSELSFSSLCNQSQKIVAVSTEITSSCLSSLSPLVKTSATVSVTSPLSKRHNTNDVPPAKFARTISQEEESVPHQTIFSDYRSARHHLQCPSSVRSCSQACSHGEQTAQSASQSLGLSLTADMPLETSSSSFARLSAVHSALESSRHTQSWNSVESGSVNQPCSLELRMEETNVNELASYFEDLLHIPRKMSTMAEMMYA